MFSGRPLNSVERNPGGRRYVRVALIHRNAAMIRPAAALPLIVFATLGLALSGCGTTMEQKAATGAVAGAVVAGPVGAAVGAAMAKADKP